MNLSAAEKRRGKQKRSMKDMELHPTRRSFSSKRGLKSLSNVFSESLIPPVCNVTPHEHKDEMSEHFCFCTGHTMQTLLPNWILWPRFNMFGGFWQCIFSKSVTYVSWVRSYANKKFPLAGGLFLNKVQL